MESSDRLIISKGKSGRIFWLDGLKGISCILIFVHHFILAFFPSAYTGKPNVSHLNGFDTFFAQSAFSVFFTGNFLVCIFCCISGSVLSYLTFNMENCKEKLPKAFFKRYPRLVLPVFVISAIVCCMMYLQVFSNVAVSQITLSNWFGKLYRNPVPWQRVFYSSFITVWFNSDNTFSTAFWMLTYIFYGSILTFFLTVMSWNSNRKIILCYIVAAIICIKENSLLLCFVFGTLLAYIMTRCNIKKNIFAGIIFIMSGLFLGGYPSGMNPTNYYALLAILPKHLEAYKFYHMIGAAFLIFGIYMVEPVQKFLSVRIFQKLGKISFAVYLVHIPVLTSFSTIVFMYLYKSGGHYCRSALISFLLSLILIISLSILFNKFIENNCTKLINYIENKVYYKQEKCKKPELSKEKEAILQ